LPLRPPFEAHAFFDRVFVSARSVHIQGVTTPASDDVEATHGEIPAPQSHAFLLQRSAGEVLKLQPHFRQTRFGNITTSGYED